MSYYDPYVPVIRPTREHPHWAGKESVEWRKDVIQSFDLILVSTAHQSVNYKELAQWAQLIVDTRNAFSGIDMDPAKYFKA